MALRLSDGVDLAGMRDRYGLDVWQRYGPDLQVFVDAGLLRHEPGRRLALSRDGMLVANDIMTVFISPPVR
jgi:coproporphyrinogen III oxidase-like Fe-S oxidoreductase